MYVTDDPFGAEDIEGPVVDPPASAPPPTAAAAPPTAAAAPLLELQRP